MNSKDKKAWTEKTKRLNENRVLSVGLSVKDIAGHTGVVVKIEVPEDSTEHGIVYVWQSERMNYGNDNCEHYSLDYWKDFLRVID